MEIRLSIVVPVYNEQLYISYTLESLIKQEDSNLEIILVDDGSSDESLQICHSYAKQDARMRVISQPNGGVVRARLAGAAQATGDYLYMLDGGDYLSPDFCVRVRDTLRSNNYPDVVMLEHAVVYMDSGKIVNLPLPEEISSPQSALTYVVHDGHKNMLVQYVFRRQLADKVHPDPELTIGEDLDYSVQLLLSAQTLSVCHHIVYYYLQLDSSVTHDLSRQRHIEDWWRHTEVVDSVLRGHPDYADFHYCLRRMELEKYCYLVSCGRLDIMERISDGIESILTEFPDLHDFIYYKRPRKLLGFYKNNRLLYGLLLWHYRRKGKIRRCAVPRP